VSWVKMMKQKRKKRNEAILTFDFVHIFPYKFWISAWSKDQNFPSGFRYKLLSSCNISTRLFELVIVLEKQRGNKKIMKHLEVSETAIDRTCAIFVDGLSEAYDLDFEAIDLSNVSTSESFERVVRTHGWTEWQP
jgi:hypothetical protein